MTADNKIGILISQTNKEFFNVRIKIKNPHLSNSTAWQEAQPLFEQIVDGYPDNFLPYQELLRQIFDIRRDTYLKTHMKGRNVYPRDYLNIDDQPSKQVQELIGSLKPEEQDIITGLVVCIRDFFNVSVPHYRRRP